MVINMLNITTLKRVFIYNGVKLPDPGSHLSPDEVRYNYSASYGELCMADVLPPETKGNELIYRFEVSAGGKG